jgi:CRISPR/Cas system Type II protein with McrA/HNH and RuvC-like nuclease domain
LKQTATTLWGDQKRWPELKQLLENQRYICVYTGRDVRLGANASIDHILPRARNGSNDISNLQWVDIAVNCFKLNQLGEEVLQLAFEIARYNYNEFKAFMEGRWPSV